MVTTTVRCRTFLALVAVCVGLTRPAVSSWVDPDTPMGGMATEALSPGDDREYQLVFSDEFEVEGRTFHDGNDPRWTAINKNDYTNEALHYYSHDNARTSGGVLSIKTEQKENTYKAYDEKKKVYFADKKYIQSSMLQGWNKFCFIGGIVEFSAKLPGDPKIGGLWPAMWMLGNLARATYVGSSNFVWPYSYNGCDSQTRISQEISACSKVMHYGMEPYVGRGSPEIDILEAMQGDMKEQLPNTVVQRPYQSTSLQIAPGIEIDRPVLGKRPHEGHWYEGLKYGNESNVTVDLNPFFYGVTMKHTPDKFTYQADAISANLQLTKSHYETMHKYRVEWEPPSTNGTGGHLRWYTDEKFVFGIHGESLDIMKTEVPAEPMYLIMNTAVASSWGFPSKSDTCKCESYACSDPSCRCAFPSDYCKNFPASFEIDYVRVYQAVNESKHVLGCSPEHKPTRKWIEGHPERYMGEGDKVPLHSIKTGGMPCSDHSECGGIKRGACTNGICLCLDGSQGPNCLAHAAFYTHDSSVQSEPFFLSSIMIPKSLIFVVLLLMVGFVYCLLQTIRVKSREARYQRVPSFGKESLMKTQGNGMSYQDPSGFNYAMPQDKVNTYCVIDSRLVDSR